jgi:hypothetical protein
MANPNPDMSGLRKFGEIPAEEHRELARKGADASNAAQRRKKSLREVARALLEAPLTECSDELAAALEAAGLDKDHQGAMMLAALRKSETGDIEASRFVRDTSGQAPTQQVELGGMDGKPIEIADLTSLTTEELNKLISASNDT